ncbi:hypothetical protein GW915_06430 [bacterium]|nr:hypothetical protein [bacterium]
MKSFKNLYLLSALASVLMLNNCASVTNLQSAETLPEGEYSHTIAAGYGEVNLDNDNGVIGSAAAFDYMLRYGLTDQDEIGFRLVNFATYFQGDYKRKLYDDGAVKLSAGLGLGGTKVTIGVGTSETSLTFVDVFVPVYADYWFDDLKAIFISPKYMLSFSSGGGSSETFHRLGGSVGFRWGKSQGVLTEVGYLKTLSEDNLDLWQVMVGGFF